MNIVADLHTHSIASTHAFSTVDELCRYAAERKLKAIALTDHGVAVPDAPHEWHFITQSRLPKYVYGVRLLSGCEANITDSDGTLDMSDGLLKTLDFVIASFHRQAFPWQNEDAHTSAWLAAVQNPLVDCLGHMGRGGYFFDIEKVVKACKQTNTLIEVNNSSFSMKSGNADHCKEIILCCKAHALPIIVASDAHTCYQVGEFDRSIQLLEEIDFPEELIVNSSVERLASYFKIKKDLNIF